MERPLAAQKVSASIRAQLSGGIEIRFIHATRKDIVLSGEDAAAVSDDRENLLPSSDFFSLLGTFDLLTSRSRSFAALATVRLGTGSRNTV